MVFPYFHAVRLVIFLLIFIKKCGHIPHDAGLSLPRCGDHYCVQAQRLTVSRRSLYLVFPLQAGCQHTQADHRCHVRGSLTVFGHRTHIIPNHIRESVYRKCRQITPLWRQRNNRLKNRWTAPLLECRSLGNARLPSDGDCTIRCAGLLPVHLSRINPDCRNIVSILAASRPVQKAR